MKSWKFYVLSVVLAFSLAGAGLQAATITKGLIGTQDINLTQTQAGAAETFSRSSSTGTTLTLNKLDGNAIPWSSAYTRTILPLHITGNASTSALTGFLTGTFSGTVSAATLTATGAATVGTTLGVTGAATFGSTGIFTGALTSDSITTGAGTFSGDVNANGDIVGDAGTTVQGMARYDLDTISIDTGTAAPTSGTYVAGTIVINSAPTTRATIAATGAVFWRCITGGTPGTWEAVFPVFTVAPDNAAMTATQGMIAIDNTYIHVAINDDEWERVAVASW